MKFLEIINKCLLELNYKQVNTMSELVKNDHKRLIAILNVINKEICNADRWNFLLRKSQFILPAQTQEITNPIKGRILYLFIDGKRFDFCEDIENFISGKPKSNTYSEISDKLLFSQFSEDKKVVVIYYTNNSVVGNEGVEKMDFEEDSDSSLIPMPYVEQLLVYGACLRLKANPQYHKFSYWMSMYKEALLNLKSKTVVSVLNTPTVSLFRT
jgi:hypothetical protein